MITIISSAYGSTTKVHFKNSQQCKLVLFSHYFIPNNEKNSNILFNLKEQKCHEQVKKQIISYLKKLRGKVNTSIIKDIIPLKSKIHLEIQPKVVHVYSLNKIIKKKLHLKKSHILKEIKFVRNNLVWGFDNNIFNNMEINCHDCKGTGRKNLTLTLTSQNSSNESFKKYYFSAIIYKKVRALIAQKPLSIYSDLANLSHYKFNEIITEDPSSLILDKDKIKFYKLNKNINSGSPITYHDIVPLNIIKFGDDVNLIVEGKGMKISTFATAMENGKIYEQVKLKIKNKKNKTIQGKVVNFKTVKVEL